MLAQTRSKLTCMHEQACKNSGLFTEQLGLSAGFECIRTQGVGDTHVLYQQMTLKLQQLYECLRPGHSSPHGVLPSFQAVKSTVAASCKTATITDMWCSVLSSAPGVHTQVALNEVITGFVQVHALRLSFASTCQIGFIASEPS
jgi:hypothetical protein